MIYVQCIYQAGDRALPDISDVLIITEAEAIERGYAELDKTHKIKHVFNWTLAYNGQYYLRPGNRIGVTCAELGLDHDSLLIKGLSFAGKGIGVTINLTLHYFEFAGRDFQSAIDTINRVTDD